MQNLPAKHGSLPLFLCTIYMFWSERSLFSSIVYPFACLSIIYCCWKTSKIDVIDESLSYLMNLTWKLLFPQDPIDQGSSFIWIVRLSVHYLAVMSSHNTSIIFSSVGAGSQIWTVSSSFDYSKVNEIIYTQIWHGWTEGMQFLPNLDVYTRAYVFNKHIFTSELSPYCECLSRQRKWSIALF